MPIRRVLHGGSHEFSGSGMVGVAGALSASGAWPSANKAFGLPFRISSSMTVNKLGWFNGSGTMTDSCDVGIYTPTFVKVISSGGTARSGLSAWQWVDVSDTVVAAGIYFLVTSNNGTTANNARFLTAALTVGAMDLIGGKDSADALYPLPDPLTNMTTPTTFTRVPVMGISVRTAF